MRDFFPLEHSCKINYHIFTSLDKETLIKTIRIVFLISLILFSAGCVPRRYQEQRLALSRELTIPVKIIIYAETAPDWNDIYAKLNTYANTFDYRREESSIHRLNRQSHAVLEPETASLVRTAQEIALSSEGAFDPTILPLTKLWNLGSETLASGGIGWAPPSAQEILEARKLVNYHRLRLGDDRTATLPEGFGLDLGGIAKGAIVDGIAAYLTSLGYTNFLIEAGGDLLASGNKLEPPPGSLPWQIKPSPWVLAIRHPRKPDSYLANLVLDTSEKRIALVTSGDYERFIEVDGVRYHHLLDPATGYPAPENTSVTVIAGDCTTADALSTAAFVMGFTKGTEYLESLEGVEGLLIRAQAGKLEAARTSGFPLSLQDLQY